MLRNLIRPRAILFLSLICSLFQARDLFAADLLAVIAGGGGQSPAVNGPAIDAVLRIPRGIAVDSAGNVFFTDTAGIRKIDPTGFISTPVPANGNAGSGDNGPAANATLNTPISVAVDAAGNLFIVDVGDSKVRKIDTVGTITTVAGNGVSGHNGDGGPATAAQIDAFAAALDQAGNLYLLSGTRVRKVDASGNISTVAGGGTSLAENVSATTAALVSKNFAVDAAGNIYVDDLLEAQLDNGSTVILPVRLRRIDGLSGMINTIAGGNTSSAGDSNGVQALAATILQFPNKNGMVLDSAGNLYFGEVGGSQTRIRKLDAASQTISQFIVATNATTTEYASDGTQSTITAPVNLTGTAIDAAGNFYISTSDGVGGDGSGLILKVTRGDGSVLAISVQKALLKLNFSAASSDSINLAGSLTLPLGFIPKGKVVQVSCGTLQLSFTLDAKGSSKIANASFKLEGKMKKGAFVNPVATFAFTAKKQPLITALAGLGFTNATIARPGIHLQLPVSFIIDGATYETTIPVSYTARQGKSGVAK